MEGIDIACHFLIKKENWSLIETSFQKLEFNWHLFKSRYQIDTSIWKWVLL